MGVSLVWKVAWGHSGGNGSVRYRCGLCEPSGWSAVPGARAEQRGRPCAGPDSATPADPSVPWTHTAMLHTVDKTQPELGRWSAAGSSLTQENLLIKSGRPGAGCSLSHLQENLSSAEIHVWFSLPYSSFLKVTNNPWANTESLKSCWLWPIFFISHTLMRHPAAEIDPAVYSGVKQLILMKSFLEIGRMYPFCPPPTLSEH